MLALMRGLDRSKWEIIYAGPNNGGFWDQLKASADMMIEVPFRRDKIQSLIQTIQILRDLKPDILHTHGKGAGAIGRVARIFVPTPTVHTFHGLYFQELNDFQRFLYFQAERVLSLFTKRVITVGASECEELLQLKWVPQNKIAVIPNGMPKHNFTHKKSESGNIRIINIVRISPIKGTENLIEGIKRYRSNTGAKVEFHIFGSIQSGDDAFLEKLQAKYKDDIGKWLFFRGHVSPITSALAEADLFVTNAFKEGLPLTLLEASQSGIPCLGSDIPAHREILAKNPRELFFNPNEPDSISRVLKTWFSKSDHERENLRLDLQNFVLENFSVEKMVQKTEQIYRELSLK